MDGLIDHAQKCTTGYVNKFFSSNIIQLHTYTYNNCNQSNCINVCFMSYKNCVLSLDQIVQFRITGIQGKDEYKGCRKCTETHTDGGYEMYERNLIFKLQQIHSN